jgi:succinate-semialdehyde dehydrogenase / glutarate-semialdehyde dehydrogenase
MIAASTPVECEGEIAMAIAEDELSVTRGTFESLNPATGETVAAFPIAGEAEVKAAVERARTASAWWQGIGPDERRRRLLAFKGAIARRIPELAELIRRENGKPVPDGVLETVLAVDHLDWAARHADKLLKLRRRSSSLSLINHAAFVEYLPLGVIGVIGPWNYPVHTPMGSISYALAAGNAVVYKPSEYTPAIGQWIVDTFATVVPEQPVLQIVHGFGDTGAALCRSGVDKLAFTGSARTGRKVMAACAENLTPVLMECGGKDALIVAEDADLDAAADAAVWGGLQNAGQACVGIERVFVADAVHDAFVEKVVAIARTVRSGDDAQAHIGPITMPGQIDIIAEHLREAFDRGARAVVGGPDAVKAPFVDPVVLVDVPDDAKVMTDETFGPVLPITRVRDADDAVRRANRTGYGLGNAVFSKHRGMELARQLRSGMVSINSALTFAGLPSLPFGGVGESGFGSIHGEDGLKEFTRPHAITRQRFRSLVPLTTFQRPEGAIDRVTKLFGFLHGRK